MYVLVDCEYNVLDAGLGKAKLVSNRWERQVNGSATHLDEGLNLVQDHGLVGKGNQRLGEREGEGSETGSEACGHERNERLKDGRGEMAHLRRG